jgi:hypothetical protein
LETDHKVIDVTHQMGFAPQPNLDDVLEPKIECAFQGIVSTDFRRS